MELLLVTAIEIANELKHSQQKSLNDIEFQPETCCALITELQSRSQGYELTEYVKAMTHAIQSCYSISKDEK